MSTFGEEIAALLRSILLDRFVGAYFVGSVALGGYVPGESDLDVVAVCDEALEQTAIQTVIDGVLEMAAKCPARGLEFTLYRTGVASSPIAESGFEVNVNGGPRMPRSIHRSAQDEPPFWYVLDRAIAHRHGVAITGPSASEAFADLPRPILLKMMGESMRWHREHEKATLYSVLNASRAWRFAEEDVLGSKLEGAAWARQRWWNPNVIDAAVELRQGRVATLDASEVDALLDHVESVIAKVGGPIECLRNDAAMGVAFGGTHPGVGVADCSRRSDS